VINSRFEKFTFPFGMVGVIFYFCHLLLGDYLIKSNNPLTNTIDSLITTDTPYTVYIHAFLLLYLICMIVFAVGMISLSKREYTKLAATSWALCFIPMQILFYLSSTLEKTVAFEFFAIAIVVLSLIFEIIITISYFELSIPKKISNIMITFTLLTAIFSGYFLISIFLDLNFVGLAQRLFIFIFIAMIFAVSNFETFYDKQVLKSS
jgi:hypothetical protein